MLTDQALPIARYRFTAMLEAPLRLPDYAGSLLRGVFGAALRRSACMTNLPNCAACPLYRSCPYPAIFETPPRSTSMAQQFSQVPNPYVIEPPPLGARLLGAGDPLVFHMVLIGSDTLRHLPLIVHAWQRALRHGLGKGRVAAELRSVEWVGEQDELESVFDPASQRVLPHETALQVPPASGIQNATLQITTPLRLQHQGKPLRPNQLDIRTLVLALVRRTSLMLSLHGDQHDEVDIKPLLVSAEAMRDDRSALRWHDWIRYSSRQQQEMTLGGVLGPWTLTGIPDPLWPWLWLGQWLHLGKNATMGMGGFSLVRTDEGPQLP